MIRTITACRRPRKPIVQVTHFPPPKPSASKPPLRTLLTFEAHCAVAAPISAATARMRVVVDISALGVREVAACVCLPLGQKRLRMHTQELSRTCVRHLQSRGSPIDEHVRACTHTPTLEQWWNKRTHCGRMSTLGAWWAWGASVPLPRY